MEWFTDKFWSAVAAVVVALGGYVRYEKSRTDKRFTKLEQASHEAKIEIAVMKSEFKDLKEDTKEIKALLNVLVRRNNG